MLFVFGLLSGTALGATAGGLHDANSVYGIDGSAYTTPWTNDQIITLLGWGETDPNLYTNASFSAYGIYSGADLTNSGAIDVNAIGGRAFAAQGAASAFTHAYGLFGSPTVEVTDNSGNITVAALGGTAESVLGSADAHVLAYGIFGNGALINGGMIDVSARAGTANVESNGNANSYVMAYGLYTNGTIANTGDVTVSATAGTANAVGQSFNGSAQAYADVFGIYAQYGVDNSGDLTVLATGGSATSNGSTGYAGAGAYGISNFYGNTTNTGNITVTATGGTDTEEVSPNATAYGIRTYENVNNSGDITVTATAGDDSSSSQAYGIYMIGQVYSEVDSTLTNTGTIRAFGDAAYELYVSGGTVTLVDTYNVTLDGNPQVASIYVAGGATLALNNAALTVTDVQGETLWNTEYQLFTGDSGSTVAGNFGSVTAINPDVTAQYYTLGTANASDDRVALTYAPQASEALASMAAEKQLVGQASDSMNQHMTTTLLYDMLSPDEEDEGSDTTDEAAPGQSLCQRGGGVFVDPRYSYIKKDNDPLGYDAGMWGASTGYTQCVNNSLLGLHLGYGESNINYTGPGYSSNSEEQEIVTSGFSGLTRWKPWLFRYGFTGFHASHEYEGLTGVGLTERETASYNSYGGTALFMVGRTLRRNQHVFLPEIGASWLWAHRQRYTTDATDASWDTTYSSMDDHDLAAEAALHWQSRYKYKKLQIDPSASIGLHQLLTDGDTETVQSVPGAGPVLVQADQDETAIALAGAVVLRQSRSALTLAYDGEFSSDFEQHNFWVKYRWRF